MEKISSKPREEEPELGPPKIKNPPSESPQVEDPQPEELLEEDPQSEELLEEDPQSEELLLQPEPKSESPLKLPKSAPLVNGTITRSRQQNKEDNNKSFFPMINP